MDPVLRIGTRGSPLALWQAEHVREALQAQLPNITTELVTVRTSGDQFPERSLAGIGIGVFSKELDDALLEDRIDIAVHSLKDLPSTLHESLRVIAVPPRESPLDAWISRDGTTLDDLHTGARVGTSSPRRRAQLLSRRPDLEIVPIRGNVDTRLRKTREGEFDGTILAHAGLLRLGRTHVIQAVIDPEFMLPAVSQGAIGIVALNERPEFVEKIQSIDHPPSHHRVSTERAFLRTLRGGCQVPVAALAEIIDEDRIHLRGRIVSLDGTRVVEGEVEASIDEGPTSAEQLAEDLLARGGASILDDLRHESG
jgi:hydroxymethylbilane synthase